MYRIDLNKIEYPKSVITHLLDNRERQVKLIIGKKVKEDGKVIIVDKKLAEKIIPEIVWMPVVMQGSAACQEWLSSSLFENSKGVKNSSVVFVFPELVRKIDKLLG